MALACVFGVASAEPMHGIALHGAPKEPPGFTHFSYVNPGAPKGGRLVLGAFGSFDSLNPLIVRGVAANGVREFTVESLMARGLDEPFTLYGLIAESVEVP
ncbi:MAG TPA: ABC transporter substrate-binding protein, partial [Hyphomicrobium sp.]|nr:ABC transporter substrate-binding protein [Hyphomicrobium sp.]